MNQGCSAPVKINFQGEPLILGSNQNKRSVLSGSSRVNDRGFVNF